ncbi:MAG: putative RecB family nuclease [Dinoroseobacter sp.]|jgi:predicted RecB family nuclease
MYKQKNGYRYSPSDLTTYMSSPFSSWMNRYALDNPDTEFKNDTADSLMTVLAKKGYEHEDALEAKFIEDDLSVVKIEGDNPHQKKAATLAAMNDGVDVIAQARLELAPFAGFADFLLKVPGESSLGNYHYEVWDTKLSRSAKPTHALQLCCYADMLEELQGRLPETFTIALGDGSNEVLFTSDFFDYYLSIKRRFLEQQHDFCSSEFPDPATFSDWGDWSGVAEAILLERDDLCFIANIRRNQIKKLNAAGINTTKELIASKLGSISGLNSDIFHRLVAQAKLQKASEGSYIPEIEVLVPNQGVRAGLALMPPHSDQDVFFDIEGNPLDDGGLEYLWGNTYFNKTGEREFIDFWAHNPRQEKQAFIAFIDWVYARWQADPAMHIYHYASYEITACKKLMSRYGVCEYEVDQLLRNEVFVDLYKVVSSGLLVGEPSYSIKNVEHLYRPKRDTEVADGGASIVVYEQWRALNQQGEEGYTWQTSPMLKDIRDYNIDDCDSTQELVDWLRVKQKEHSIVYLGKEEVVEPELSEEITERTRLRDKLLSRAEIEADTNFERSELTENMAWFIEFHRREAKPTFWRLYDRLGLSPVELYDDLDCLAFCERTQIEPFKPTPRARNLGYEYSFDVEQDFKGASRNFYILGAETEDGKPIGATYLPDASELEIGIIALQSKDEPPAQLTLVPNDHVQPKPIPEALADVVKRFENGSLGECAITDFLTRAKPRINNCDGPIASSLDAQEKLDQIVTAALNLDYSYLPIQGPPGAGKSYTAKHIIAELVRTGAKVGISSNSHKAINNLLLSTARYCTEIGVSADFMCTSETEPGLAEAGVLILKNNQLANHLTSSCVMGTTAWGFTRDDLADQLDYLFIDEAGQVSVANLIAMSRSADNLVLIGDQMQLGQPSQGTHPADSGLSILDYLLRDTPTISDDMGVFLGTTYRMHPSINDFISKHVYEGKLASHSSTELRSISVPPNYTGSLNKEAGIIFEPVEHEGNSQSSDEEVARITELAAELLGREFIDGEVRRPVQWNDILFVAPYNHQVSKLKMALGDQANVGSVDKFQGQEAPIVILSMCASDATESPRGIDFLFNKNRLNVAISRAQCLAIVVANPSLANTPVNSIEQMKMVSFFSALNQYNSKQ